MFDSCADPHLDILVPDRSTAVVPPVRGWDFGVDVQTRRGPPGEAVGFLRDGGCHGATFGTGQREPQWGVLIRKIRGWIPKYPF